MDACMVTGRSGVISEGETYLQAAHWVERFEHPARLVLQLRQHAGKWHEACTSRLSSSIALRLCHQRSLPGKWNV